MNLQDGCVNTLQKSSAFNLEMEDKTRFDMLSNEYILNQLLAFIEFRTDHQKCEILLLKNAPKKKI